MRLLEDSSRRLAAKKALGHALFFLLRVDSVKSTTSRAHDSQASSSLGCTDDTSPPRPAADGKTRSTCSLSSVHRPCDILNSRGVRATLGPLQCTGGAELSRQQALRIFPNQIYIVNTTPLESDAKQERDKGIPKGFEGHSRRKEALKRRGILDGVANKKKTGGERGKYQ